MYFQLKTILILLFFLSINLKSKIHKFLEFETLYSRNNPIDTNNVSHMPISWNYFFLNMLK